MIIAFLIGGFISLVGTSIFAARAYDKGYKDASDLYEMMLNGNRQED